MQISKITKCSLVNIPPHKQQIKCIPPHKQQNKCIPPHQQQKNQSCVKLIEYQKVYLIQYGHFMNVIKRFTIYACFLDFTGKYFR